MRARSQLVLPLLQNVRRRILVSFARTGLGHGRQRSQGAYDIHPQCSQNEVSPDR